MEKLGKSEHEQAVILDAMTELVIYLDVHLRVIWANKAMRDAFNLSPNQLRRKKCFKALHNRNEACRICPAEKTLQTGEPHEVMDFSSYKKDWILRSYPVHDENGILKGIVEIVTDITERRKAEESLKKSEHKYRELYENANDIIFILDFNGKILSSNAAFFKTYDYEPEHIKGRSIEHLLHPDDVLLVRQFLQKKANAVYVQNPLEFRTITNLGETIWLEVNARTVKEGRQVSIHGIARNITERKRMEDALKKRERELEEKSMNLKEANSALRVLLKRREEDKTELEEKVLCNVRELILPYIENLKLSTVDKLQQNHLRIIERNINEITSPFLRTLFAKYPNLTPTEIKLITFIKEGRTTKEMAELINVSARTVDTHRDNIRKKLGLKNKKFNLRSYLMSI